MSRICQLFSGSSGNCTFIGNGSNGVLVDVGVSASKITAGLNHIGILPENIQAIFITHEHSDHIMGLKVFAGKNNIPVFMTAGTIRELEAKGCLNGKFPIIEMPEEETDVFGYGVKKFHTCHDAADSCGYVFTLPDSRKAAVCTDLGYVGQEVHNALLGVDTIVLESNHDIEMLKNGPYPAHLKRRIMGVTGHLSNVDCASEAVKLVQSGTTRFILSHISRENNAPFIAKKQTESLLSDYGMKINKDYLLYTAKPSDGEIVVF